MTYQIKCNGDAKCLNMTREQAIKSMDGFIRRAMKKKTYIDSWATFGEIVEYFLLTEDNGLYEMRLS